MPKYTPDEATIRKLTEKYVKSLDRDVENIPDIKAVITEALKDAAPERDVDPSDINKVIIDLNTRPTITNKIINEVAKKVADNSANDDLVFSITQYIKQLKLTKKKPTSKDIEEIIKFGKLDPYTSTPFQIKNAVRDYFSGARPVEAMSQDELRDIIKTELAKLGPVDERDVVAVLKRFLDAADPEKPLDILEVRDAIKKHLASKPTTTKPEPIQTEPIEVPTGDRSTPVVRPEKPEPGDEPEDGTPKPPEPRTSKLKIQPGAYVPPIDAKNMTFFERTRKRMERYGLKSLTRTARNWLGDTISKTKGKPSAKKLITQGDVAAAFVGNMFMYFYDAKTKAELPYWDKFPLIFVIDLYDDGWLGLNLHYLPMPLRIKLFDRLMQLSDSNKLDHITKLRMSYSLIKDVSKFPEARPCIKRYLSGQVRSDLIKVAPIDWEIAVFMPVEQFQKQPRERVWKDSRAKIKGKK